MTGRRIVVAGTLAAHPYAGRAWMHTQIAAGLLGLGHDVCYVRKTSVDDSDYAVPHLERSACHLAAGRPVITQDTGLGDIPPAGERLVASNTTDEALAAIEAVNSDYARHSRAAYAIAEESVKVEKVLANLLEDLRP